MSMGVGSGRSIPALTVRVARASNPRGTPAMWVRDRLDELFTDEDFADWFPADGRRGLSPTRLAMVSVLQYAENLTDRQAAEAVRCRLDWKYCLGMDLDDSGFDYSVLSEFRDRMAQGDRADRLLAVMVDHLVAAGLVKRCGGRIRTDSTHVLGAVRTLSRIELVAETLRAALERLALEDEEWLAPLILPGWAERYGRPALYHRLPKGKAALEEYALQVGRDGIWLLRAVFDDGAPPRQRTLSQVETLRQVWVQQYWHDTEGHLRWRAPKSTKDRLSRRNMPPACRPSSVDGRAARPGHGLCPVGQHRDRLSSRSVSSLQPRAHRVRDEELDRLSRSPERDLHRERTECHCDRGDQARSRPGHRCARGHPPESGPAAVHRSGALRRCRIHLARVHRPGRPRSWNHPDWTGPCRPPGPRTIPASRRPTSSPTGRPAR
ncbi:MULTISPECIES: transposase [unclassified Streptomyces]|uniref:transposase n=1 Tax=unclassified Streptomyces TaxID=2593676 RepID=UPI00352CBA3B